MEYTERRNVNRGYMKLEVWQRAMDQFHYTAKGSLAESFTRACGLSRAGLVNATQLDAFDSLHYEVENKLLHLISSLEAERDTKDWRESLPKSPKPIAPNVPSTAPTSRVSEFTNPLIH